MMNQEIKVDINSFSCHWFRCVQHEIKYGINSFSCRGFPCINHEIKCYINSIWSAVWPTVFYGCTEPYGNWYKLPYLSSYKSTDARCVLQKQVRVLPTNASTYRVAILAIKEKVCVTEYSNQSSTLQTLISLVLHHLHGGPWCMPELPAWARDGRWTTERPGSQRRRRVRLGTSVTPSPSSSPSVYHQFSRGVLVPVASILEAL